MSRLVIKPQTPGGGLGFDLRDVLQALRPRVSASAWTIDDLNYVSRDEREIPTFHVSKDARISGHELLASLPNLLQVVYGEFRAFEEDREPWVVVRAVDSSWWEVVTQDAPARDAIRRRFQHVDEQV